MDSERPSWDEYFMKVVAVIAERSTCNRHHIGAMVVRDKRMLTTGYNGAVKGARDCLELGCLKDEKELESGTGYEICRAVHAEENAITQGAHDGTSVSGGTMYCTHSPCMVCAKSIVNAGIKEVVTYQDFTGDKGAKKFLEENNVGVRIVSRPDNIIVFKD